MARGGQQTVLLQNYKTWDGVDQTLNVRVGPCATLDADPPSSANGIVLEPGQAMEWRVSAFGPCVISEGAADAGARVGAVCGGGALR